MWQGLAVFLLLFGFSNFAGASHVAEPSLAPSWGEEILRWESLIVASAAAYQIDPDLIAAIVDAESDGNADGESYAGAVGLMGVMPYGEAFEHRPNRTLLRDPKTNIDWGTAIISDIMQQAGGDLHAALAAYNGGWPQVDKLETRTYAANVLNLYGRAIASREGVDPDSVAAWTVAIRLSHGHIATRAYVAGDYQVGRPMTLGEHVVYANYGGVRPIFVRAYAVPLDLKDSPLAVWKIY
jgi:hypothetical protein